jgi:hypothetical protein
LGVFFTLIILPQKDKILKLEKCKAFQRRIYKNKERLLQDI